MHPIKRIVVLKGSIHVTNRFFILLERQQKLDDALQFAESRAKRNPFEIVRLKTLRILIKNRMASLLQQPAIASVH